MTTSTPEHMDPRGRQDPPVEDLIAPLREVLEAVGEAQRRSEQALQAMLQRLAAVSPPGDASASAPTPPAPEPTPPAPEPAPTLRAVTSPSGPSETAVAAPVHRPRDAARPDALAEAENDPRIAVRRMLAQVQRAANEIDRIVEAEGLDAYIWKRAEQAGLRGLRLQEKGRSLYAEDSFGFVGFEGDRSARLRKVVVPYDVDGLFGVCGQERAVYSGPRPSKGMPVDLVLVMGKQAPTWSLVVPMPYRNRWGTFLYFDADGDHLEAILELELVARLAVLQLRAARFRPHEPAERVRDFRAATLKDRQERRQRAGAAAKPTEGDAADPLSRKRPVAAAEEGFSPPGADRFDHEGRLVHPLDGRAILARMGELPPMPQVATRLIGLLNDPQTEIAMLQEIMATDQAISVRLLQIANSSLYGTMREVSTIAEAVMRLGFTAIRSWLLATVTRRLFTEGSSNVHCHRLWRQSVLNGMASQLVAERSQRMDPDTAFMGGLLQNIGLLLLARNHPGVFEQIDERARADRRSYFEIERLELGFDHADVSGLVLQKWGLGETLVGAVSAHHRLGGAGTEVDFAAIIALGEELALRVGEGPTEAGDDDLSATEAARHLGLDGAAIDAIADALGTRALDREIFSS